MRAVEISRRNVDVKGIAIFPAEIYLQAFPSCGRSRSFDLSSFATLRR